MKAIVAAVLLFAAMAPSLQRNSPTTANATVQGKAVDDTGAIIAQARAALINLHTLDVAKAVADRNGEFAFAELQPGTYELVVAYPARNFLPCVEPAVRRLGLKAADTAKARVTLSFRNCKFVE
jgi:hypothetical protein